MDKRSATISARVTPELERVLEVLALARDTTLSDLVFTELLRVADREHARYLKLQQAFGAVTDKQGLPDTNSGDT